MEPHGFSYEKIGWVILIKFSLQIIRFSFEIVTKTLKLRSDLLLPKAIQNLDSESDPDSENPSPENSSSDDF